jgi:hypothetical protein
LSTPKQCAFCGRKGVRAFVPIGLGGFMCKAALSCRRRRDRSLGLGKRARA